jgi:hypothetical protein
MDWWYILWGIALGWSIPWAILRISDGMFLLDQIFRILYWGTVLISFEFTDWHWALCLLSGLIPGGLIWGCYDNWFHEDEFQTIEGDFELVSSETSVHKSDSLIVWNIPGNHTS